MILLLLLVSFTHSFSQNRRLTKYNSKIDGPWYYSQLTKYQKPFYEALEYWRTKNELIKGAPKMYLDDKSNKRIKTHVEENIIIQYTKNQSSGLDEHFLSAVAAWRFDHPEIFYIDVTKLRFKISFNKNNEYKILFGFLFDDSALFDYIKSDQLASMITNFNIKVKEMIDTAQNLKTISEKVTAIHNYIKKNVEFRNAGQIPDADADKQNYVYSSYGCLINNVCSCDGFTKLFQVAMNQLEIPSLEVPGEVINEDYKTKLSWNVVELEDGDWYLVDVTTDTVKNTNKWLLVNQLETSNIYFPNGKIDDNPTTFYFPPTPLPKLPNVEKWSINDEQEL